MNLAKKIVGHTKTVLSHKIGVAKICFKFGLYWQGIVHDFSKFNPIEFIPSIKYYSGVRSPIEAEKEEKGYSMAWLHHKAHNKHHYWFWVDWDSKQCQYPVRMPLKYVYEMIADTVAAGKVYSKNAGKEWRQSDPYKYYMAHNRDAGNDIEFMDFCTKAVLDNIYVDIMKYGMETVSRMIREGHYEKFYKNNTTRDGKEVIGWIKEYNDLVLEYYKKD